MYAVIKGMVGFGVTTTATLFSSKISYTADILQTKWGYFDVGIWLSIAAVVYQSLQ